MLAFTGRYFFDFSRRLSRLRWSEAESKWLVAYLRNSMFLGFFFECFVYGKNMNLERLCLKHTMKRI